MLFNTLLYAEFFAAVFVVSWLLTRTGKLRVLFLLAASYAFYAHFSVTLLPLIFLSSSADYFLGRAIGNATEPRRR